MRICVVSHSNVALRQQLFWKEFSKHAEVLVISPERWVNGLETTSEKNGNYELFTSKIYLPQGSQMPMAHYTFPPEVFFKIEQFKPDIIYNQQETYCNQSMISQQWAKQLGCKYVQFSWENIRYPTTAEQVYLRNCDLIICGNTESKELCGGNIILPQAGISLERFYVADNKDIDVLYLGRKDESKGLSFIKSAYPDTTFIHDASYDEVPGYLSRAKVVVNFPTDGLNWKEQFSPFSIIESMASGCAPIVSKSSAPWEWLKDGPVTFVPQQDTEALRSAIDEMLKNADLLEKLSDEALEFVKRFGNGVVAEKLFQCFKVVLL
ncbi:MAG: glycosyltransferase [Candidatus Daviesbacteria bacterium]|nr:glycosyltransferase [Candidatus Daviesbacteria bacterium]